MKRSFKSQLNYADIHQSPMLKCFFHKILKLLSAVTNCSSHNPRGLKEQARSLFFARDAPAKHHLMVPQSSFPAHRSSGEVQRTSTASSFPGSVLFLPPPAPDKRGPSINSNIQTTSLQAFLKPGFFIPSAPALALHFPEQDKLSERSAEVCGVTNLTPCARLSLVLLTAGIPRASSPPGTSCRLPSSLLDRICLCAPHTPLRAAGDGLSQHSPSWAQSLSARTTCK